MPSDEMVCSLNHRPFCLSGAEGANVTSPREKVATTMTKHLQTSGLERRREDYGPITGRSNYVDDLKPPPDRPPALHMVVVRSPYAHARIKSIQLDVARSQPGIIAAFEGADLVSGMPTLDTIPLPGLRKPERRPMAVGRARYVGEPVAVILAESLYDAEDARDLVDVEDEPLPPVTDPETALESGAPLLYQAIDSNIAFVHQTGGGDIQAAFEKADHIARLRIVNQRLAPSPLSASKRSICRSNQRKSGRCYRRSGTAH